MKIHDIFYLISIFIIFASLGIYFLSTTAIFDPSETKVVNLAGKRSDTDSTLSVQDEIVLFQEIERSNKTFLLWIGIPLGIILFVAGLVIKRRLAGPDLFIDDEDDDFF